MYIVYTTLIFLNAHLAFSQQQWVDPHDMNIRHLNIDQKPSVINKPALQQHAYPSVPINFSMSHYKRLINLILSAVVDNRDDLFKGHLYINLPHESYDFLKTFTSTNKDLEDSALLRKVDQILSNALAKPRLEQLTELLTSWADRIYFTIYSRTTMIYTSCLFVLFISYKLLKANLTIWSVVKYLLFLAWVADFAFTWINLLQEAEINRMADSLMYEEMPPYCNPDKMSFWQYLRYSLSSTNECRKYHQTIYKDHFWSIAPVVVLSHQFGTLIYTPASLIGQALGSFTSGLLSTLPWGVNIILLPFLLIFSATIMCISISFLSQTSFKINIMHLLQLEFGNDQRRRVGDVLSGHNLNALLNMAHRNMVEDVRQNENSTTEISASSNTNQSSHDLMVEAQGSTSDPKIQEIENNVIIKEDVSAVDRKNKENPTTEIVHKNETNEICGTEALKSEIKELNSTEQGENISKIEFVHDGSGDKL